MTAVLVTHVCAEVTRFAPLVLSPTPSAGGDDAHLTFCYTSPFRLDVLRWNLENRDVYTYIYIYVILYLCVYIYI